MIAAGQTSSLNFPVANAIQPTFTGGNVANTGATKGFVTKYTPDGSALVYSTYFGGSWKDSIAGLAVDPAGNTYITGKTSSTDYPTLYAARPNLNSVAGYKSTNGGVSWSAIRGGLSTGYVQWLVVDPANSLNVYGATRDRGIFASSDGGNTWQSLVSIPGVLAGTGVRTWMLAMTKTTPTSTLYAATVSNGDYDLISSTDGGQSWKFPKNPLPAAHIYAVAADPTNPKNAYYTASNGTPPRLYRSTDAGDNGTSTGANIVGFPEMLVVDPTNSAHIYVAALDGVYLSNDTGVTWKKANTGFSNSATWSIAQDPATPSTLYAGTPGSVYRSTDSGDSWTLALTSAGNTFVALAIDPNNHAVYAGGGAVMFKSTDGGANWAAMGVGLPPLSINTIALDPNSPSTLFVGQQVASDMFATKLDPSGGVLYSTYLGGNGPHAGAAIAADAAGNAYLTGSVCSVDFPLVSNLELGYSGACNSAAVVKIDPWGTVVYSTVLTAQANFLGAAIAVDAAGSAYVAGSGTAAALPEVGGIQLYRGGTDAFIVKIQQ